MARGSIYPRQLKDGATVYDVRYRTSNGVSRQKRGFRKEREAQRFLNAQLAAVDRGAVVATDRTFAPREEPGQQDHKKSNTSHDSDSLRRRDQECHRHDSRRS